MLGKWLVRHLRLLREFNIPEPVAGGLVVAVALFVLNQTLGCTFSFSSELQMAFMLVFSRPSG